LTASSTQPTQVVPQQDQGTIQLGHNKITWPAQQPARQWLGPAAEKPENPAEMMCLMHGEKKDLEIILNLIFV
jgi:hypothetical protein